MTPCLGACSAARPPSQRRFSVLIPSLNFPWCSFKLFPHAQAPHTQPVLLPQETVQILQAKVNTLDVAVLDQVEARLQVSGDGGRWG